MALGALLFFVVRHVHGKHFVAGDADEVNQSFRLAGVRSIFVFGVFQGATLVSKAGF